MRKIEYKVCGGTNGIIELEREVSSLLNKRWKPVGGITFYAGFPYQALARVAEISEKRDKPKATKPKVDRLKANSAMRKLDDLT